MHICVASRDAAIAFTDAAGRRVVGTVAPAAPVPVVRIAVAALSHVLTRGAHRDENGKHVWECPRIEARRVSGICVLLPLLVLRRRLALILVACSGCLALSIYLSFNSCYPACEGNDLFNQNMN